MGHYDKKQTRVRKNPPLFPTQSQMTTFHIPTSWFLLISMSMLLWKSNSSPHRQASDSAEWPAPIHDLKFSKYRSDIGPGLLSRYSEGLQTGRPGFDSR
jgi:hypothetical protein